ncbi:Gfo/Idh/MocA family protein [Paenibacillus cremeus]|uniref:Gfo/Idh/MocA family oxidoreductase n=1 Tax=Paenibacillus cremeus TaxID=2163881 RepID=A0A559JZZ2_9BACL|nr:Gfo/Idh/MocA family oxidoreductase [Paenibacillus cremeus]TVY05416.1 Gfo/Idh/MocA family oxidoreductase [Paenibacillus cremeus]
MSLKSKVKLGVVGIGGMGSSHLRYLTQMDTVEVVGVCDVVREKADKAAAQYQTKAYYSHTEMFDQSGIEAILIAVPHYDHTTISIEAFQRGIHVLCEKPIAVHVNDAKRTIEAYEQAKETYPELIFGIMFQERTYPFHKKIKDILEGGELGKLIRATWINTKWFRSQLYYDSGDWRATWAGEGGGILTNQCPHNLDLYQWLFGLPSKINGFAHIGKYHDIEVEDEVTGYFEHENGMVGHFIVTTAETPGSNRMEIVGEYGKLIFEDNKLVFYRTRESSIDFIKNSDSRMGNLENWYTEIPVNVNQPTGHRVVTEKFIAAIQNGGGDLIAHGPEGINGLTLANAIMLSSFNERAVRLPIDGDEYEAKLKELIQSSKYKKPVKQDGSMDISFSQA